MLPAHPAGASCGLHRLYSGSWWFSSIARASNLAQVFHEKMNLHERRPERRMCEGPKGASAQRVDRKKRILDLNARSCPI